MQNIIFFVSFCMAFGIFFTNVSNPKLLTTIYSSINFPILFKAVFYILTVITFTLFFSSIPYLDKGWMHLFNEFGGSMLGQQVAIQKGLSNSAPDILQCYMFFLLFLFAIPYIAHTEEQIFRKNTIKNIQIIKKSLLFGGIHLLVGLPISIGLSLSVIGLLLGFSYKEKYLHLLQDNTEEIAAEKAMMYTTTLHTAYNSLIICMGVSLITYYLIYM